MKKKSGKYGKYNKNRGDKREATNRDQETRGPRCPVGNYDNDVAWYGETPALIRDSASLSFGYPLGKQFINKDNLPGAMRFEWIPAVGISNDDGTAPVNMAARNIYSWVRHANSGHTNYDSPDLMLYLLAMDSAYYTYAMGVRAYGLVRQFSHVNRYWGKTLVEACGFDYDDLLANLADMRLYLNTIAKKLGSMCVPDTMPYFKRHVWMSSNVFTDSPTLKSQVYVYTPQGYWAYDETDPNGGKLAYNSFTNRHLSLVDYQTTLDGMISLIIASEDLAIMSGDILKAFGDEKVIKLATIDVDYVTPIVYNPEVLTQIQNMSILGALEDGADVIQDPTTGILTYNPRFDYEDRGHEEKYITMPFENVTPEQLMVATRLTAACHDYVERTGADVNRLGHAYLDACGSEIVCGVVLYTAESPNGVNTYEIDTGAQLVDYIPISINNSTANWFLTVVAEDISARQNRQEFLEALSKFASHPAFWYSTVIRFHSLNNGKGSWQSGITDEDKAWYGLDFDPDNLLDTSCYWSTTQSFIQDIDNFTVVSNHEISEMHNAALLSMFGVPAMGSWNNKLR